MEDNTNAMENLNEEQQSQVFHLMELANIDNMDFAAQMLIQFNFDVEKAAQQLMGIQSSLGQDAPAQQPDISVQGTGMNIENQGPQRNRDENDLAVLYRRHLENKQRQEEGQNLTGSNITNAMNSIMSGGNRSQSAGGEEFVNFMKQKYSDLNKTLKFNTGTFEEALKKAAQYKKPLLVYVHDQSPDNAEIPREIFGQSVLANLINSDFYFIGVLAGSPAAIPLKEYVDVDGCSSLNVFRTNLLDDVVRMETIILTNYTDVLDLQDQLRSVHGTYYMILTEEDKVKNEVRRNMENERRRLEEPNYGYHGGDDDDNYFGSHQNFGTGTGTNQHYDSDLALAEQQRLEEDRILRQIQEEEFKEAERKIREKQQDQDKQAILKKEKEAEEQKLRKQQEDERRIREEEKEQQRDIKIKRLPAEPAEGSPNAVNIVFRTPNGNNLERRFNNTDKVQALYDYIDTQDVTFDKATIKYDLIQPRPFLCLEDQNKTINDYFEGSTHERVQIREHSS